MLMAWQEHFLLLFKYVLRELIDDTPAPIARAIARTAHERDHRIAATDCQQDEASTILAD